jgi:hypothetical protein
VGIFDDLTSVPALAMDYRFAGLVRLCGLGVPAKWIETKGTRTSYRGPIAIYATHGKATANDAFLAEWFAKTRARLVPEFVTAELFDANTSRYMRGKVIALATIDRMVIHCDYLATRGACVGRRQDDEKKSNHVGWRLSNIWPLDPFNAAAMPGFFTVQAEKVELAVCTWFFTRHARKAPYLGMDPLHGLALARTHLRELDLPGLGARWGSP